MVNNRRNNYHAGTNTNKRRILNGIFANNRNRQNYKNIRNQIIREFQYLNLQRIVNLLHSRLRSKRITNKQREKNRAWFGMKKYILPSERIVNNY